jgi:hypothetical protein
MTNEQIHIASDVKLGKSEWEELKTQAIAGLKRALVDQAQFDTLLALCENKLKDE